MSVANRYVGWQTALLVIPVVYLIYRSYGVYLGRLEDEKKHAEEMAALHLRTIEALALAIEAKDHTTHDHLHACRCTRIEIGKELGLNQDELEALRAASLLHDIGKLAVPEHIISKPGRLTPEEFEKMKIHPVVGAEILERVQFPVPGGAHRSQPPREVGRLRLSRGTPGRRDSDRRAHSRGRRLPGRARLRSPVPPRAAARRSDEARLSRNRARASIRGSSKCLSDATSNSKQKAQAKHAEDATVHRRQDQPGRCAPAAGFEQSRATVRRVPLIRSTSCNPSRRHGRKCRHCSNSRRTWETR